MGIRDNGSDPARQYGVGKLAGNAEATFDVDMGIDQTRGNERTCNIGFIRGLIGIARCDKMSL